MNSYVRILVSRETDISTSLLAKGHCASKFNALFERLSHSQARWRNRWRNNSWTRLRIPFFVLRRIASVATQKTLYVQLVFRKVGDARQTCLQTSRLNNSQKLKPKFQWGIYGGKKILPDSDWRREYFPPPWKIISAFIHDSRWRLASPSIRSNHRNEHGRLHNSGRKVFARTYPQDRNSIEISSLRPTPFRRSGSCLTNFRTTWRSHDDREDESRRQARAIHEYSRRASESGER